jgi:hypothetical protein
MHHRIHILAEQVEVFGSHVNIGIVMILIPNNPPDLLTLSTEDIPYGFVLIPIPVTAHVGHAAIEIRIACVNCEMNRVLTTACTGHDQIFTIFTL